MEPKKSQDTNQEQTTLTYRQQTFMGIGGDGFVLGVEETDSVDEDNLQLGYTCTNVISVGNADDACAYFRLT